MSDHVAPAHKTLWQAAWDNPILLLALTALIWAGHAVVGRLAVGQIAPMTLTTARWALALGPIMWAARSTLRRDLEVLRPRWLFVGAMGALGFTGFNALFYAAAHSTGALNMSIIQGAIPALVLIGARLAFGVRITAMQALGTLATMIGVAAIAAHGEWSRLATFAFNPGDLLMLLACVFYAFYTLGLRERPDVSGLGFLAAMAFAALVTSIPLFVTRGREGRIHLADGPGPAPAGLRRARPSFLGAGALYARRPADRPRPRRGVRESRAVVRRVDGDRLARRAVRRLPSVGARARRRRHSHRAARAGRRGSTTLTPRPRSGRRRVAR